MPTKKSQRQLENTLRRLKMKTRLKMKIKFTRYSESGVKGGVL